MFFIFSKILSFFLNPFFWIMVLLIWSLLTKNLKKRKKIIVISFLLVFVFGNSVLIHEINMKRERKWRNTQIEQMPDTAILLGGFCFESDGHIGFSEASDRFLKALRLFQSNKINTLVISGGSGSLLNPEMKEALLVKKFMSEASLRMEGLIIESESKNTFENATFSAAILGLKNKRILLVTSAFHMQRAMKVFKKNGFDPIPYPTHFLSGTKRNYSIESFLLPSPKSFLHWEITMKEWLGLMVYKFKGYI
jgi:uncharacterized SAM-binding protein YcdF (DUF218 family)